MENAFKSYERSEENVIHISKFIVIFSDGAQISGNITENFKQLDYLFTFLYLQQCVCRKLDKGSEG